MTRHLFQCGQHSRIVSNFIKMHHYDACNDGWQTAAYTEELFPVFTDTNSYILMDEHGECRGLYSKLDSLASIGELEFDSTTMRASSIFSMLTTHGVLRSDGELFFKWIPKPLKDKIHNHKIKDIHGSDWMLSCIAQEPRTILVIDVSVDSCMEFDFESDAQYCYVNNKSCYIVGRDGVWRNSPVDGKDFVLIYSFKKKNNKIYLIGRSNNYMVIRAGKKTVIFAGEDVFPLDMQVRKCYTFPKCMVIQADTGFLFSTTRADSDMVACIKKYLLEVGDEHLAYQSMVDPALTVKAGRKEFIKDLAGFICTYRQSSLSDDDVCFILRNEPEFFIERMSRNERS